MKRIGAWVGVVMLVLLGISLLYPQLTGQVLAHAAPDVSLFANWLAAQVMGTGTDGVTMAHVALAAMPLNDLRQKLGELTTAQRALLDKARAEQRAMTGEEDTEYTRMDSEVDEIDQLINQASTREAREARIAEREQRLAQPAATPIRPSPERETEDRERDRLVPSNYRNRWAPEVRVAYEQRATPAYRRAFESYLIGGEAALSGDERRALSVGTASEGGYTVPSEEFVRELLRAVDNATPYGALCRKFDIPQAMSLGVPTLEADPADADWTTELETGSADSTMAFGKRELNPNPLAKLLKVSKKLLRASPLGVESIVRDRLAYKVAVPSEKGFMTGTGASQPLGIFTASADGIPTGRDTTISTSSAIDPDKLITLRYTLREGYKPVWTMHRTTLAAIRKLKATTGDYLWQPGLSAGAPSVLLEFPYVLDEYAPAYATAGGSYVCVLGDPQYYWIARALGFEIQRLDELYAATNQVGFIVRAELDGAPVLSDAFVRGVM